MARILVYEGAERLVRDDGFQPADDLQALLVKRAVLRFQAGKLGKLLFDERKKQVDEIRCTRPT